MLRTFLAVAFCVMLNSVAFAQDQIKQREKECSELIASLRTPGKYDSVSKSLITRRDEITAWADELNANSKQSSIPFAAALACMFSEKTDASFKYFQQACEASNYDPGIVMPYSGQLKMNGRPMEAAKVMRKAQKAHPKQRQLQFMLAMSLMSVQEYKEALPLACLLYTSPSPRDKRQSRMPSSA